jgi:hypothetical protein
MRSQGMEFQFYPSDNADSNASNNSCCWYKPECSLPFDNTYSFSVVYKPDFPFPSIHYPSQEEDLLDPQFTIGCVHGGGSMLSSLDVSLESCLGMFP